MAHSIKLLVWGPLASFNRPEMKVERVSYDVMTPSAARGILEAIYWKPQMRWCVEKIHVLSPIRFTQVRRNEISCKIPAGGATGALQAMKGGGGRLGIAVEDYRQQRAGLVLRDVRYGLEARVEVIDPSDSDGSTLQDPEAKHLEMFRRRAARGQCFHHPYLGCREFPAEFQLVDAFPAPHPELLAEKDLGFMLQDIDYRPSPDGHILDSHRGRRLVAEPRFFRATLRNGAIDVPPLQDARA